MISDTLFEAIQDIRQYQDQYPHSYEEVREEIDALVGQMQKLRIKLDKIPTDEEMKTATSAVQWAAANPEKAKRAAERAKIWDAGEDPDDPERDE